jgi:hypothetical protein
MSATKPVAVKPVPSSETRTIQRVRKWVRENGGNGERDSGFYDQFHGLRKILGMPTSEEDIVREWNEHHKR